MVKDSTTANPSPKITSNHPSIAIPSIQTFYVHQSFSEAPKSYTGDDNSPFLVHVSKEVLATGTTIRAVKFSQFFIPIKLNKLLMLTLKTSAGKNAVEFSSAQAANLFMSNLVIELCKYKSRYCIDLTNITWICLVKGVPVDWSMQELVDSLEFPSGCHDLIVWSHESQTFEKKSDQRWNSYLGSSSIAGLLTLRGQMLLEKIYYIITTHYYP